MAKTANLTVSFEIWDGSVTGLFSWDVSTDPPHQPLTGYQVTWLELVPNTLRGNKMPQSLISQSQILPPVSVANFYHFSIIDTDFTFYLLCMKDNF